MSTATPAATQLADFSDRLSPMVVKELRQGLRTHGFSLMMLGLHLLLICFTLISGAATRPEEVNWMLDGLATLVLCLLLPLRGVNALAEEVKRNTLDMLVLTRLSAGRIVFGKWASICAQTLLLTVSIMPYVVARYVFGGAELFGELSALLSKWLASCVVAAFVVLVSTLQHAWRRGVVLLIPVGIFLTTGFGYYVGTAIRSSSGVRMGVQTPSWALGTLALTVAAAGWLVFAFLSTAATRIAPTANLLSLVKRPVHLGVLLVLAAVACATGAAGGGWLAAAVVVGVLAAVDVFAEPLNTVPSVYIPFYKRGLPGRLAMPFLAPGWASGFRFAVLVAVLLLAATWVVSGKEALVPAWLAGCTFCCAWSVVMAVAGRRGNDLFGHFFAVALLLYLASLLMGLSSIGTDWSIAPQWSLVALPSTASYALAKFPPGIPYQPLFTKVALGCSMIWPLLLAFQSWRAWRWLGPVRAEARRM